MTNASVSSAALEEVPLFQGLTPEGVASLADLLRIESFSPGSDLLVAGRDTPGLYVLRSGTAAAIVTDAAGIEREVATLGRGECLGEMSLISGEPCSATVRAITETEAWLLRSEDFVDLVQHQPELWRNLGRILSQRLARTSRSFGTTTQSNVVSLISDLPEAEEVALALAVGDSLARQTKSRTLVVDASESPASQPVPEGTWSPSLAALIGDKKLLSAHDRPAHGDSMFRACSLVDSEHPSISEGDVLVALDWLRPQYDCLIVAGGRNRQSVQKLQFERSRSVVALVTNPGRGTPDWLDALLGLPDTARKLEIAVVTTSKEGPRLIDDVESARERSVVRLLVERDRFTELPSAPLDITDEALLRAVDRLARVVGEAEIGVALGAGAAKGFAHIGVLRVLEQAKVPVDYVVGCSIGAVVGSQYAYGIPLEDIARGMHGADKKLTRWTIPLRSVWSNRGLKEMLSGPGGRVRFRDLPIPFAAVATDVATGRELVLRRGIVWRAVMASTSVPGIFPPVVRGRRQMVDGGLVNPVPSRVAKELGADIVVAVDLMGPAARAAERAQRNGERARVPNLVEMLWRANEIMQEEVTVRSAATADVTIEPKLGRVRWSDFSRSGRRFVEAGEDAAREKLPDLLALIADADAQSTATYLR